MTGGVIAWNFAFALQQGQYDGILSGSSGSNGNGSSSSGSSSSRAAGSTANEVLHSLIIVNAPHPAYFAKVAVMHNRFQLLQSWSV